jgi:hypothetical protein
MNLREIIVLIVIQISPNETVGAAAPSRPALAAGPCLNVQGSTFKA